VSKRPKISVGIPAYNSAAHIGLTIEGLLSQTYGDFELIVSDNASTDATRDIVGEYMRKDPRIRYERHSVNVGANPNYSYLVHRANGEFFKWSSSSDWCAPTFLESCLSELTANPDSVLAVPRTCLFQDSPKSAEAYDHDISLLDDSPSARLRALNETIRLNNAVNGLIRASALRSTRLVPRYIGADVVFMEHLALLGKFRLIDQRLFYRRMDRATATALQDDKGKLTHHYPKHSLGMLLQGSKKQIGRLRVALRAPLSLGERMRVIALVAKMIYWERAFLNEDARDIWQYVTR
jgi:glycosyltransferase involved in cell wall biosynthesis